MGADIELNANLVEKQVTLGDIVDLKEGDILPVEMPDQVVLRANGVPVFDTQLGVSNGHLALKITDTINVEEA